MPPKKQAVSMLDAFRHIGSQLSLGVDRPNLYGYRPHPKQIKFHSSNARGRLYIGGNRSGKTTGGVIEDIWTAKRCHPYRPTTLTRPIQGRVIGVDFLNGIQKIILPEFARWLPPSDLINGSWEDSYAKGDRTLTLANGSFIEFMSYDQELDKFAGTSRDFIHYDEEPPQEIFTENSARLIDVAGSWWMTMTPVNGMTWIYDDIYLPGKSDPASAISVIEVHMDENPYIPAQEVAAYAATLSADEKSARLLGKFIQMGGLVYKAFDTDKHVIDAMIPPKEWEWYASCDHGYNNPTAWLWHAVSPDGTVITFDEHYEAEQTVEYHAATVHEKDALHRRIPDYYVGDPALSQRNGITGTNIFQEYLDFNIPILPSNNDVLTGLNKVNQYLYIDPDIGQPNWYITRNCGNLIREMLRLRFKSWASRKIATDRNKQDLIHKKDDHACDSARYFFTFLPDLKPLPKGSDPLHLMMPSAPVGIDAFIPTFRAVADKMPATEWSEKGIDETLGGIW